VDSRRTRSLRVGLVLAAGLALAALLAPMVATSTPIWADPDERPSVTAPIPYDPGAIDLRARLSPPSRAHWLGTDALGRDVASRLLHGSRVSLSVGLLAALAALAIGIPLGAVAGYRGGWIDHAVSRCMESILCFPSLLLALALLAAPPAIFSGLSAIVRVSLVIAVSGWIPIARFLRAEILTLRDSDLVRAAEASGLPRRRILVRHLLPGALAPVLVTAAFAVAGAMTLEAALSFLGLGVPPPTPTWGGLLFDAREHIYEAWWLALFPGVALFAAVLTCNLIGEGLRDRLDPRTPRR